jgi:mannose-6-phosphate isomerase-like protein (cupin superfamily)
MAAYTTLRFADLDNGFAEKGGEFYMGREGLESPQVGVTWIRLPAGISTQGDKGHYHDHQDEVYVVAAGGGPVEFKVGEDSVSLGAGEAIRIDAKALHAVRNGGEDEALLIAVSGQLPDGGDDSHPVEGFAPGW